MPSLNKDSFLDIIVPNLSDPQPAPGKTQSFGGTPEADTYIYWGGENGYHQSRRLVLPSVGAEDAAAADLNRDGLLDVVLTSYHAGHTRSHPSYIYWNSPRGFDPSKATLLPTNSASGVLVADFNRDSHLDILFACHSKNGNHRNDSFLYWGSSQGFAEQRRSLLPGLGPHFLTVMDIGHIYDRGDAYEYISTPFDAGSAVRFGTIRWEGETPFRTRLEFRVRVGTTRQELLSAPWQGPQGPNSFYRKPHTRLSVLPDKVRWIQYMAVLISPDSANTPVLRSVSIDYF